MAKFKKSPTGGRLTEQCEMEDRRVAVVRKLAAGVPSSQIAAWIETEYGVGNRMAWVLIGQALEKIRETAKTKIHVQYNKIMANYDAIISDAMQEKHYDIALKALAQKSKLCGLDSVNVNLGASEDTKLKIEFVQKLVAE